MALARHPIAASRSHAPNDRPLTGHDPVGIRLRFNQTLSLTGSWLESDRNRVKLRPQYGRNWVGFQLDFGRDPLAPTPLGFGFRGWL